MKAATISKEIAKKMRDWTSTIEDEELRKKVLDNVVVTGGCIVSMYLKERVNDFDVYIRDKQVLLDLVIYYNNVFQKTWSKSAVISFDKQRKYVNLETRRHEPWDRIGLFVKSNGFLAEPKEKGDKELGKYRPVFMSENAITLSEKIQIVVRFWGEPETVHESFDFEHAKGYWTLKDGLVSTAKQLQLIIARELQYTGSQYPLASIFRSRKFIMRGWSMHIRNYLLMALQLQGLDLTDIETLREQLTGVDAAYLGWIAAAVEKQFEDDEENGEEPSEAERLHKIFDIVLNATYEFGDERDEEDMSEGEPNDTAYMSPLQKRTSPANE